ncbi:MAG: hypothetical protein ACRETH_06720 [Steroidobacteraceae bacterium]
MDAETKVKLAELKNEADQAKWKDQYAGWLEATSKSLVEDCARLLSVTKLPAELKEYAELALAIADVANRVSHVKSGAGGALAGLMDRLAEETARAEKEAQDACGPTVMGDVP